MTTYKEQAEQAREDLARHKRAADMFDGYIGGSGYKEIAELSERYVRALDTLARVETVANRERIIDCCDAVLKALEGGCECTQT